MQKNKRKRTELQEMKTAPGLQRRTLSLEGGLSGGEEPGTWTELKKRGEDEITAGKNM